MHPARVFQVPVRLRDLASALPTEEVAARIPTPSPDDGYSSDDSLDSSYDGYAERDRREESGDSSSDDESIDGTAEPAWVAAGESCFHNGAAHTAAVDHNHRPAPSISAIRRLCAATKKLAPRA